MYWCDQMQETKKVGSISATSGKESGALLCLLYVHQGVCKTNLCCFVRRFVKMISQVGLGEISFAAGRSGLISVLTTSRFLGPDCVLQLFMTGLMRCFVYVAVPV